MFKKFRSFAIFSGFVFALCFGATLGVADGSLVDPTQAPPALQKTQAHPRPPLDTGDWVLQAVFLGEGRKQAIINGQTLTPGMMFRGARLTYIGPQQVTLRDISGRDILLSISNDVVKTFHSGKK